MPVKKVKKVEYEEVKGGTLTQRQVLIGPEEGPNFAMRRFVMEPGGGMPLHTNTVEHEQYVTSGCAKVIIGDEAFEVEKDDVVFIPAGTPHSYEVLGNEPFVFLCIVPNKEDEINLLE